MDQSAETIAAIDNDRFQPGRLVIRSPATWWLKVQAAVWPVTVVMINEDGKGALEMKRIRVQQPVQTFGSHRPDEAFRDPICLWDLNRRQDDPAAWA